MAYRRRQRFWKKAPNWSLHPLYLSRTQFRSRNALTRLGFHQRESNKRKGSPLSTLAGTAIGHYGAVGPKKVKYNSPGFKTIATTVGFEAAALLAIAGFL